MSTLLKLTETKSQQSRVTLLHHVLEVRGWGGLLRAANGSRGPRGPAQPPGLPLAALPRPAACTHSDQPPSRPSPRTAKPGESQSGPREALEAQGARGGAGVGVVSEGHGPELLWVGLSGGLGCVASVGLTEHIVLQEVEESHPDLLQLPQDLELPARAAG